VNTAIAEDSPHIAPYCGREAFTSNAQASISCM